VKFQLFESCFALDSFTYSVTKVKIIEYNFELTCSVSFLIEKHS